MPEQCDAVWVTTRCELTAGHDSAHASRAGAALITWANYAAGDPTRLDLLWATDDEG